MIPVAQLDPASLTLWLDTDILGQSGEQEAGACVTAAVNGQFHELSEVIENIDDPSLRGRCAHLASTVWHEQRHFLDLVLSNHGALRFRAFSAIYVNLNALLYAAKNSGGILHCPLSIYTDPVLGSLAGVGKAPEELVAQSHDILRRTQLTSRDRRRLPNGVEVGGDAQLEALAYLTQVAGLGLVFGPETSRLAQADLPEDRLASSRYDWIVEVAERAGLINPVRSAEGMTVRDTVLQALLLASLATRSWGQDQTPLRGQASPGWAADRLAGLIAELRRHAVPEDGHPREVWAIVNEAAAELWGRTVIEEMRVDHRYERTFLDQTEEGADEDVHSALSELHGLRGALIDELETQPQLFVDSTLFTLGQLPSLRPMPVTVTPGGRLGEPGEGWTKIWGYRPDDGEPWWWAAVPDDWSPTDVYALRSKGWRRIVEWWAPLTKLMAHGRRQRVMLGPEMITTPQRLANEGLEIRFDPRFAFPDSNADIAPAAFFHSLARRAGCLCDFCRTDIHAPDGWAVSPWALRRYPQLAQAVIAANGDDQRAMDSFFRDWSVWILCDDCAAPLGGRTSR